MNSVKTTMTDSIVYEHPTNDCLRACIRIEHLLKHTRHNMHDHSLWGSRNSLATLLDILSVVDRPDLKGKFAKTLAAHSQALKLLQSNPHVDPSRLEAIITDVDELAESLHENRTQLGKQLREHSLLRSVRQHSASPGGACPFNTPAFHLWLHQPSAERQAQLNNWLQELSGLFDTVDIILKLTRGSSQPRECVAEDGFYQQALDPQNEIQLIRVEVPGHDAAYPEISVGKHRLAIHFFRSEVLQHDMVQEQSTTLPFSLTLCP